MKITKQVLKRLIKEELITLQEAHASWKPVTQRVEYTDDSADEVPLAETADPAAMAITNSQVIDKLSGAFSGLIARVKNLERRLQ